MSEAVDMDPDLRDILVAEEILELNGIDRKRNSSDKHKTNNLGSQMLEFVLQIICLYVMEELVMINW